MARKRVLVLVGDILDVFTWWSRPEKGPDGTVTEVRYIDRVWMVPNISEFNQQLKGCAGIPYPINKPEEESLSEAEILRYNLGKGRNLRIGIFVKGSITEIDVDTWSHDLKNLGIGWENASGGKGACTWNFIIEDPMDKLPPEDRAFIQNRIWPKLGKCVTSQKAFKASCRIRD